MNFLGILLSVIFMELIHLKHTKLLWNYLRSTITI